MSILQEQIKKSNEILDQYLKKHFNSFISLKDGLIYTNLPIFLGLVVYVIANSSEVYLLMNALIIALMLSCTVLSGIVTLFDDLPEKYVFNEKLFLTFKKMFNDHNLSITQLDVKYTDFDEEHNIASIYLADEGMITKLKQLDLLNLVQSIRFIVKKDSEELVSVVTVKSEWIPKSLTEEQVEYMITLFNLTEIKKEYVILTDCSDLTINQLIYNISIESTRHNISIEDISSFSKEELIDIYELLFYEKTKLKDYLSSIHETDKIENSLLSLRFLQEKYHQSKLLDIKAQL